MLKDVIRGGGDIDALIAREEAVYAQTLKDLTTDTTTTLSGWHLSGLAAIANRTVAPGGDYSETLEKQL